MAETDKIVFGSQPFQFPVGYILMSANNINPVTFLNYGIWSLIGNGRTILGATEDDNGEETGGSMSKTLSASNIPGHTHSYLLIHTKCHPMDIQHRQEVVVHINTDTVTRVGVYTVLLTQHINTNQIHIMEISADQVIN